MLQLPVLLLLLRLLLLLNLNAFTLNNSSTRVNAASTDSRYTGDQIVIEYSTITAVHTEIIRLRTHNNPEIGARLIGFKRFTDVDSPDDEPPYMISARILRASPDNDDDDNVLCSFETAPGELGFRLRPGGFFRYAPNEGEEEAESSLSRFQKFKSRLRQSAWTVSQYLQVISMTEFDDSFLEPEGLRGMKSLGLPIRHVICLKYMGEKR